MSKTLVFALGVLALCSACQSTRAPSNRLSANYHFTSVASDGEVGPASTDTNVTAFELTYEFLPITEDVNLALSYLRREDEFDVAGGGTIDSNIARLQLRWHYAIAAQFMWYIGIGGGYAFGIDGSGGADFDGSLYYDGEAGLRWAFTDGFGIQGGANYAFLNADGSGTTPDVDLAGLTFFLGAFADLGGGR